MGIPEKTYFRGTQAVILTLFHVEIKTRDPYKSYSHLIWISTIFLRGFFVSLKFKPKNLFLTVNISSQK